MFMANNEYRNTISRLKFIRETDYQTFVSMKKEKHLQLSDYSNIWKVIILLLVSQDIEKKEIDSSKFSKNARLQAIKSAVDEYYSKAFSPEIVSALSLVKNTNVAIELFAKHIKLGTGDDETITKHESNFQVSLMYLQRQFERALSKLKLKLNKILFIDGVDIRPGGIQYSDYLECVKGLADAVWSLNNDFFANIKDSLGRVKVVLLLRPDIFNSLGLQNSVNKLKDNSVLLDWRTTYPEYRESAIFKLSDQLLSVQQELDCNIGQAWDYYFPWRTPTTNLDRDYDDSFITFLRISYSRPRDIVSAMQILKEL